MDTRTFVTIAAVLMAVTSFAAQQQAPARYTPAKDARDLKAVLFNWAWCMGMLRGPQETGVGRHAGAQGDRHDPGGRAAVPPDQVPHQQ